MLPLSLLTTAKGHPMLVELKNGETYNGHLVNCDTWMNLTLREVIQTSMDGTKFHRLPECYIRGSNIKYLRVPDEIIDLVRDQNLAQRSDNRMHARGAPRGGANRGGHGLQRGGMMGGRGGMRGRGGMTDRGRGRGGSMRGGF
ncbi:hypothetical protein YB2330_002543 [Saitoella coloradoensis]